MTIKSSSPDQHNSPDQDNCESLLSWLNGLGAEFSAIELKEHSGNRGVFAREPIKAKQCFISIPVDACFYNTAQHHAEINALLGPYTDLYDYLPLVVRLAQQLEDPNPYWLPYLESLPSHIDTLVGHYPEPLRAALKISAAWPEVFHLSYEFNQEVKHLQGTNNALSKIKKGAFYWARILYYTRAFRGKCFGWIDENGMIPLIDLCNHANDYTMNLSYNKDTACFEAIADRDIEAGEEITFCYGEHTNTYFLSHYGFTLADNPKKTLLLRPRDFCEAALTDKAQFSKSFSPWLALTEEQTSHFLLLLNQCRALSASVAVCEAWVSDPKTILIPDSLAQEAQAFHSIACLCQHRKDQLNSQAVLSRLCQQPANDPALSINEINLQRICLDELTLLAELEACCQTIIKGAKNNAPVEKVRSELAEQVFGTLYLSLPDEYRI